MAKFIVPLDQLPPPASDGTQKFRFRIITEDKNVISYWSPIFKIINNSQIVYSNENTQGFIAFSASAVYDSRNDAISVTLDSPGTDYNEFIKNYDIFVKWDSGSYDFYNRMNANGISIANSGSATVRVKGQYPSQYIDGEPVETQSLKIFETSILNLIDLRDTALISASVTNISASVTQINQNVADVEGLIYALSWYTGGIMGALSLPERGQPLDVNIIYDITEQVNTLTNALTVKASSSSQVNKDTGSVGTSSLKFYAETKPLVATSVSGGQTEEFTISYPTNYKYTPVVTVTVLNNTGSNAGNNVTIVLTNITTSLAKGIVRYNEAGTVNLSVNSIVVGLPQ